MLVIFHHRMSRGLHYFILLLPAYSYSLSTFVTHSQPPLGGFLTSTAVPHFLLATIFSSIISEVCAGRFRPYLLRINYCYFLLSFYCSGAGLRQLLSLIKMTRRSERKRKVSSKALDAEPSNRPMKKAKNVTAGIGRGPETEGTAISSYGRNVDGQEVRPIPYPVIHNKPNVTRCCVVATCDANRIEIDSSCLHYLIAREL